MTWASVNLFQPVHKLCIQGIVPSPVSARRGTWCSCRALEPSWSAWCLWPLCTVGMRAVPEAYHRVQKVALILHSWWYISIHHTARETVNIIGPRMYRINIAILFYLSTLLSFYSVQFCWSPGSGLCSQLPAKSELTPKTMARCWLYISKKEKVPFPAACMTSNSLLAAQSSSMMDKALGTSVLHGAAFTTAPFGVLVPWNGQKRPQDLLIAEFGWGPIPTSTAWPIGFNWWQ